jgi:hypothetical protein
MKKLLIIAALLVPIGASAQESYVQLPPNSTGVKLRMRTSTQGANTVASQGFFLDDGSGSGPLGISSNPIFVNFVAGATTAITAASLPLPTGAASEATLAGIKAGTDKIPSSPATDRTTAGGPSSVRLSDGSAFYKPTTPSDTQPISASSLPLPTGAATSAAQTDGSQKTQLVNGANAAGVNGSGQVAIQNEPNIDAALSTRATESTLAGVKTGTDRIPSSPATDRTTAASPFSVRLSDGSAFFDPRSIRALTSSDVVTVANTGFVANAGTNLNTSALALESGGNLAAIKTDADKIPSDPAREGGNLAAIAAKDFATSAKQDTGNTSLGSIDTKVTGVATATNQSSQIASEQSIDSKIPAQKNNAVPVVVVMAPATPPVLTAAQLANPLLYRAAMRQFCSTNLCQPTPIGR